VVSGNFKPIGPSKEFEPVYSYFDSCIQNLAQSGLNILGTQGGYVQPPQFIPGSDKYPTSSQLDFFNFAVPYWYYVSGNGIVREQVPQKSEMEKQLSDYINEHISECDFSAFLQEGYSISINYSNTKTSTKISENSVEADVYTDISVSKGSESSRKSSHVVKINSKIGKFYNIARGLYDKEQSLLFLENYGVDILRLYAPVDGAEITCSPKVWNPQKIVSDLQDAIEANTLALKVSGNYYTLNNKDEKYFVIKDFSSDENVNFIYDKKWPFHLEVWPAENGVMLAKPIGTEAGLGVLGFCYVPYHFVYDVVYPVLIQVYDNNEIFQFPIEVVIDKNVPRNAPVSQAYIQEEPELCKYKNSEAEVYTYDTSLNPVQADISFKCFDTSCDIGSTKISDSGNDAYLKANFPQCVNGFIIAKADGYEDAKYMISTNEQGGVANILMNKLYKINISLILNQISTDKSAIIYFKKDDGSVKTLAYPEQKEVEISEGQYEIDVQVFSNASIYLQATTQKQCTKVPAGALGGIFGITKEQCFNIEIPAQTITNGLSGGGKANYYFAESELASGKKLEISAGSLPVPQSIEDLQKNYELVDTNSLEVLFV
jgi:hypothetical protein